MDGDDRRRSQYGQPYQTPGSSRPPLGQPMGPPTTDRFPQPSTPVRSDPTMHSMSRSYLPGYPGYGYQDPSYTSSSLHHGSSPMQGVEMQYSPAYVQDVSRQHTPSQPHPQHQYPQYPAGAMLPSTPQQGMYESIPQYQQRQSAAIEVMSSQMGAIPHYMQHPSSQYSASQAEQPGYPPAMPQAALQSQYGSQPVGYGMMEEAPTEQAVQPSAADQEAIEEGLREYERQLRATFDAILAGRMTEAGEKILALSRWLTSSVVSLGLHHDDESRYNEQLQRWRNFNLCWEAFGQRQKDMTEEALRTGRQPADLLSSEKIHTIIDELLSLCDQLEPYGLVDYEMGIAEEQITHIFTVCLDMLQRQDPGNRPQQGAGSTS